VAQIYTVAARRHAYISATPVRAGTPDPAP
jgi:hypothetical protein